MKYRATLPGFIDRLIHPGDIVEVDGEPPILGLEPLEPPVDAMPQKRSRARAAPVEVEGDEADVI